MHLGVFFFFLIPIARGSLFLQYLPQCSWGLSKISESVFEIFWDKVFMVSKNWTINNKINKLLTQFTLVSSAAVFRLVTEGCVTLHRRIQQNKSTSSSIGQHFRVKHSSAPKHFSSNFSILKKCKSKFDCLVFEMFFTNELRPSLSVQSDSRRAEVFK